MLTFAILIELLLNSILECLKEGNENKEIFHKSLKSIYETYFIKDTVEFKNEKKETITYEKLLHNETGIKFCVSEISRNIVKMSGNTSKPDYEGYKDKNGFGLMTIIIGGDKLSRGVTFDGLGSDLYRHPDFIDLHKWMQECMNKVIKEVMNEKN